LEGSALVNGTDTAAAAAAAAGAAGAEDEESTGFAALAAARVAAHAATARHGQYAQLSEDLPSDEHQQRVNGPGSLPKRQYPGGGTKVSLVHISKVVLQVTCDRIEELERETILQQFELLSNTHVISVERPAGTRWALVVMENAKSAGDVLQQIEQATQNGALPTPGWHASWNVKYVDIDTEDDVEVMRLMQDASQQLSLRDDRDSEMFVLDKAEGPTGRWRSANATWDRLHDPFRGPSFKVPQASRLFGKSSRGRHGLRELLMSPAVSPHLQEFVDGCVEQGGRCKVWLNDVKRGETEESLREFFESSLSGLVESRGGQQQLVASVTIERPATEQAGTDGFRQDGQLRSATLVMVNKEVAKEAIIHSAVAQLKDIAFEQKTLESVASSVYRIVKRQRHHHHIHHIHGGGSSHKLPVKERHFHQWLAAHGRLLWKGVHIEPYSLLTSRADQSLVDNLRSRKTWGGNAAAVAQSVLDLALVRLLSRCFQGLALPALTLEILEESLQTVDMAALMRGGGLVNVLAVWATLAPAFHTWLWFAIMTMVVATFVFSTSRSSRWTVRPKLLRIDQSASSCLMAFAACGAVC
jgi:hypothetical protein